MQIPRRGHVLIVDDEAVLAGVVASYLDRAGFDTTITGDGLEAVDLARRLDPTVVILDLGLPGLDGVEVCRQIRTFSDCYVIMLTARTEEVDVLIGLSVGADDYVTKPFSARELVARVQVMLRRPRAGGTSAPLPVRRFGTLEVDASAREARLDGAVLDLTPTEFDLLAVLSERPRLAHSRRQLLEAIWGDSGTGDDHLIDVHVANLRRKLGDDPVRQRYVITVRGVGYRMGSG
ncbi:MAG: DNA-binding response regulator [Actinobacteria bacterium HGW-Actinobacteria-5]|jgi:DNA-binding response OmpR family regulator|nr:MAG: DNA-binding response regulator [Actinobacteria bacterium HGW-Actinobacteria-5]